MDELLAQASEQAQLLETPGQQFGVLIIITRTGDFVATFKQTRVGGKLVKQLAVAAALCTASVAQAGVLNFEGAVSPFVFANETVTDGKYWMTALGGAEGDLTGMFINGAEQADICAGAELKCPQNNSSTYYAALADSYLVFGLNSGNSFRLDSFSASFIGTGGALTRGLLLLQGYGQDGLALGGALQIALPVAVNGQYNFGTFNLGAAFSTEYAAVRFLGYGCDASGMCFRNLNGSNFAIDNIVTSADIPEPASFGLLGLGLLGMAALRRRKHAA
nr:NF038120 family PEP-CTERM protein [Massilia agrisoli]